jgi:hypothetical protein
VVFDIDSEMVIDTLGEILEGIDADISEVQFMKICEAIDNEMPGVIAVLTQGMAEQWKSDAVSAGGWGVKYAPAIQYKIDGNTGEVYLDEDIIDKGSHKPNILFAMMMEKGVKSFSIKEALLASEKAKVSAAGIKYIIIPFPVHSPRKDKSVHMDNKFGKREMSQEVYRIVKSGGKIASGTMFKVGTENVNIGGLTQYNTRQYHSQYGFFRCVSNDGKDNWRYPTIGATPIYPKVLDQVNAQIHDVMTSFCEALVREYSEK